jgi:hypothetical protein
MSARLLVTLTAKRRMFRHVPLEELRRREAVIFLHALASNAVALQSHLHL